MKGIFTLEFTLEPHFFIFLDYEMTYVASEVEPVSPPIIKSSFPMTIERCPLRGSFKSFSLCH